MGKKYVVGPYPSFRGGDEIEVRPRAASLPLIADFEAAMLQHKVVAFETEVDVAIALLTYQAIP
jgi:hypothetical protein